jgi:hypothetical protein
MAFTDISCMQTMYFDYIYPNIPVSCPPTPLVVPSSPKQSPFYFYVFFV